MADSAGQLPGQDRGCRLRWCFGWRVRIAVLLGSLVLLFCWLVSAGVPVSMTLLPFSVPLEDSVRYRQILETKGIASQYIPQHRLLMVERNKRNAAICLLAEHRMLRDSTGGYEVALPDKPFSLAEKATVVNAERFNEKWEKETEQLVANFDSVQSASVSYFPIKHKPLFRSPYRQRAVAQVQMEEGCALDEKLATAIIGVVTFSRGGLDERDVVVSDIHGNVFRMYDRSGIREDYTLMCNRLLVAREFINVVESFFRSFGGRMKAGSVCWLKQWNSAAVQKVADCSRTCAGLAMVWGDR